jgi:hypothetical protein
MPLHWLSITIGYGISLPTVSSLQYIWIVRVEQRPEDESIFSLATYLLNVMAPLIPEADPILQCTRGHMVP